MSSKLSYPMLARPADGSSQSGGAAAPSSAPYPVPPSWRITDPAESERRLDALLEQGERDIEAGRTIDSADVQRLMRERIRARKPPAQ